MAAINTKYKVREGIYSKIPNEAIVQINPDPMWKAFIIGVGQNRNHAWQRLFECAKGEGWDISFLEAPESEDTGKSNDFLYYVVVELSYLPLKKDE